MELALNRDHRRWEEHLLVQAALDHLRELDLVPVRADLTNYLLGQ
jgi:hypothetical protein